MRKPMSLAPALICTLGLALAFSGCEKLKVDNLKANSHLKAANKDYADEKYRGAVKEYEAALDLNPNLTKVHFYLGTAYASLFKPGKEGDENRMYAQKAEDQLNKAETVTTEPAEKERVVMAKGELFDKLATGLTDEAEKEAYYQKAEQCYLTLLESNKEKPATYYVLADFYKKHGKMDMADKIYQDRVSLDPKDPEGYLYYGQYLQDNARFDEAITVYNRRLWAMVNPSIIDKDREMMMLSPKLEEIRKKRDFIENTLKKNKTLPRQQKEQMIADKEQEILAIGDPTALQSQYDALLQERDALVAGMDAIVSTMDDTKKHAVAEAHYTLGVVSWMKSYRIEDGMITDKDRMALCESGMSHLDRAVQIDENFANPYAYKKLMYLQMIRANQMKANEYNQLAEEAGETFMRIHQKLMKQKAFEEQLEQLGTEE